MFTNFNNNVPPFMNNESENVIDIDNNSGSIDIDLNGEQTMMNNSNSGMNDPQMVNTSTPIIEPVRERVVNRTFEHIVPHICPIRTRIINHHVFKHTYRPDYSCCEENVCSTIDCGSCCNY